MSVLPVLVGGFALALVMLGWRAFRSATATQQRYRASRRVRVAALLKDAGLDPETAHRLARDEQV